MPILESNTALLLVRIGFNQFSTSYQPVLPGTSYQVTCSIFIITVTSYQVACKIWEIPVTSYELFSDLVQHSSSYLAKSSEVPITAQYLTGNWYFAGDLQIFQVTYQFSPGAAQRW